MVRWLPAGSPRAVLQLSHGMAEYAARYAPFAEACNAAGIAVYAHDHRGHGGSIDVTTPRGHYGDHDGWEKVVSDLEAVRERARAQHPGVPIFLMGHSMGSFIARAVFLRSGDALAGAIVSATGWRTGPLGAFLRWSARREVKKLGPREPSAKMAKLVFGFFNVQFMPTRTKFDWLSRDPEQVDKYLSDPMCGFDCSGQLWDDMLTGVEQVEKDEDDVLRIPRSLPLLTIAGTRDPTSIGGFGNAQVAARYRAAGNTNVTEKKYPGARHELVNETNRAEVYADLIAWMEKQLPAAKAKPETGARPTA